MRRVWAVGVVAVLALAVGCSDSGGGSNGDGGNPRPDGGTPVDGGCTGPSCNPGDGGTDGGTDGGVTTGLLTATPDRIAIGTTPGAAKSAQLTLRNTGAGPVTLQSLDVSGAQASAFQVSGGTLPADLAVGASVTVTVSFSAASAGVWRATLSAVTSGGTTTVPLGGMAASGEPSLQWIFDVHNIPVNAGNPDPTKRDFPPVPLAGDETGIQSFVKAGDGPVTLQLLASYGPPTDPVGTNGWYASGNPSARTTLFSIPGADAQVLDPSIAGGGTLSFDPGSTPFGFWNTWPFWGQYFVYQEDGLNTWDTGNGGVQHHLRVYPYRNPDGSADPHAYLVTTEEAPISAGPDYNDIVYVVRNVSPAGSAGGALQLQNRDGEPASDRMMFNAITTIASCWGPLTVKDSGVLTVRNLSGSAVTVSSLDVTDAFTATPSMALPASLAPGASMDVTVKFVATDGRVHGGTLTVHSDDSAAPARTVTLSGFRQTIPQSPNEPTLGEIVSELYGFKTVLTGPGQSLDTGGQRIAVGDEVLSSYWVKADPTRPVTVRLVSAWHSGWDCADPSAVSYGSFAYWFPRGRTSNADDRYILGGAKEDIQRLLPRQYENPANPAAGSFDPGTQVFGWHLEDEFSDESLAEQEPWCTTGQVCGHRIRFWPVKDASGATVANAWLVSIDMHRRAPDFFSNYDFNDETYLVENMMPAPP